VSDKQTHLSLAPRASAPHISTSGAGHSKRAADLNMTNKQTHLSLKAKTRRSSSAPQMRRGEGAGRRGVYAKTST